MGVTQPIFDKFGDKDRPTRSFAGSEEKPAKNRTDLFAERRQSRRDSDCLISLSAKTEEKTLMSVRFCILGRKILSRQKLFWILICKACARFSQLFTRPLFPHSRNVFLGCQLTRHFSALSLSLLLHSDQPTRLDPSQQVCCRLQRGERERIRRLYEEEDRRPMDRVAINWRRRKEEEEGKNKLK